MERAAATLNKRSTKPSKKASPQSIPRENKKRTGLIVKPLETNVAPVDIDMLPTDREALCFRFNDPAGLLVDAGYIDAFGGLVSFSKSKALRVVVVNLDNDSDNKDVVVEGLANVADNNGKVKIFIRIKGDEIFCKTFDLGGASNGLNLPILSRPYLRGSLDGVEEKYGIHFLLGWVFDSRFCNEPLNVKAFYKTACIGEIKANDFREDIRAKGHESGNVGFRLPLRVDEKIKSIDLKFYKGEKCLCSTKLELSDALTPPVLRREDVIAAFQVLFHRDPENEDAINHQLSVHKTKKSLYGALFRSPEFFERNNTLISVYKNWLGKQ